MTHACLRVHDQDGRSVLLHTTHTGMNLIDWIKNAPSVVAATRPYLRTKAEAKLSLECDGRLSEWFEYLYAVMAIIIASEPCTLCYVPEDEIKDLADWSGADDPWHLYLRFGPGDNDNWEIVPPVKASLPSEMFDPFEAFCAACERLHGLPSQYYTAYDGLRDYYDRVLSQNRRLITDKVFEEYTSKRVPASVQDDYIWFRDAIERCAIELQQGEDDGDNDNGT